jgi:2-polyprenyl-6-methoxyphenol hydroxylase-like FAD-dependent oxidoreductase
MTFDVGPFALRGTIPDGNEGIGGFCPRRTVLDSFLVKAAAQCRAEVRESFTVDELLMTGGTVVRVRGQGNGGTAAEERARVIVGADGVNSFVVRSVRAPEYDTRPVAACCYYSYFSGVPQDDIELYVREHCAFGGAPTNDGLHLVMVNWPARDFPVVRADVEKHVWRALEMAPDFLARVRDGRREEKWYGTAGVPGYVIFRIARPPARLRRRTTVFDARDNLGLKSRVGWSAGREGPGADHAAAAARWAGSE